jgi:predicted nicotinamide N-methyase
LNHLNRIIAGDGPMPLGYEVKFETVRGNGADLRMRSLLDRQQFHDPAGEAEQAGISSALWPLFGLLWPSGQVLAQAMQTFELDGKRILELGCGLALASLVIHRRGGDVTASDCHPLTETFLKENLRLNHLPPMKYRTGNWGRAVSDMGRFDLIIGSDVLYDRNQPQALSAFIDEHSCSTVEVVIVDPDRGNISGFNRRMQGLGYTHSQNRVSFLPDGATAYKGRVHSYGRSPEPAA